VTTLLVSFLLAFLTSVLATPAMIALATRNGVVDDAAASHRKVHAAEIPRLGGVAIVLAFYAPFLGLWAYSTKVGDAVLRDAHITAGLLGGGLVIAALGLYDDLRDASPKLKLGVQFAVAVALVAGGFLIDRVDLPFLPMIDLGLLGPLITIAWIVGVTNAVNLIDGLDGLAAGIALFALLPMAVLAVSKGNLVLALVCCCLAGAVLGFLVFNFHPARIFMGDTGSMFLGFTLAVVTVATSHKGRVAVAMLTPVLALGLPILDTLLAIARRAWFGQSLFSGDRGHIHHRLLDLGISHRNTVLVMYWVAAAFAMLGLGVHFNRDRESALLFLLSLVIAAVLLRKIGYLALPETFGNEIGQASAIRERNRLVREALPLLEARAAHSARVDDIAASAAALAWSAGACQASLDLHGDDPSAPRRSWTWDAVLHDSELVTQRFLLRTAGGRTLGTLQVSWTVAAYHASVLPNVDAACRAIAERVAAALRDEPRPARAAQESQA
jgi:UDP-GlcNAc:undecaprenyl-phosphate GlcNAc-1-phosphate transferase